MPEPVSNVAGTLNGLSVSHESVLTLVEAAVSGCPKDNLASNLKRSDPMELARLSQANHVHTMVFPVLEAHADLRSSVPRDLYIFFREMYHANQHRLAQGMLQLSELGAALKSASIPAVVLKGGGDMLDSLHKDPAMRFVGDLDVLIHESKVENVIEVAKGIGAAMSENGPANDAPQLNWRGQPIPLHHLPAFTREDWLFPVEFHTRVGAGRIDDLLPVDAVFAESLPSRLPGLRFMANDDRACHLLAHADHHGAALALRAWVDWSMLRTRCNRDTVRRRLNFTGLEEVFNAYETMADAFTSGTVTKTNSNVLARSIIRDFGNSNSRRWGYLPSVLLNRARGILVSPEYRRYLLKQSTSPAWWSRVFRNHTEKARRLR
ncbi:MAG: nucleotidyltransferase family protein [Pseudomonadota bacterium]